MLQFSTDMRWKPGSWASDGRANLYTASVSMIPNDVVERNVTSTLPGEQRPVHFAVKVERSAILPLQLLNDFFRQDLCPISIACFVFPVWIKIYP